MSSSRPAGPRDTAIVYAGGAPRPAGWRVVVPGAPQWAWGQRSRGGVLFGSWLSAMAVSAFAWGTLTGFGLLAFGFVVHVLSAVDAWSQPSFPPMRGWAPWVTAMVWLAVGFYLPALGLAAMVAWPGLHDSGPLPEGYLVDRWAYRHAEPRTGDWVWYRPSEWAAPRLGRVLAGSGQEVEWAENQLRVEGRSVQVPTPFPPSDSPSSLAYRVPEGHVLINPEGKGHVTAGPLLVTQDRLVGRAWAQFYPVLERRLLNRQS